MVRTLASTLVLAALSLTSINAVSAQSAPGGPLSDAQLDTMLRRIPGVQVRVANDGSTNYAFTVRRDSGVYLPLVVNVSASRVTIIAEVSNPFTPTVSLDEFNRKLASLNEGQAIRFVAVNTRDGKATILAVTQIGRSVSVEEFVQQWNRFLRTAELTRGKLVK